MSRRVELDVGGCEGDAVAKRVDFSANLSSLTLCYTAMGRLRGSLEG